MKLASDYKLILRKAWSVRLMALAAVLTALEVILPLFYGDVRRGTFAALSGFVVAAAFIARLAAQKDMGDE